MKRSTFIVPLFVAALTGSGLFFLSGNQTTAQAQTDSKPTPLKALLVLGGCCHDYAQQQNILKAGIEERANIIVDIAYTPDKGTGAKFPQYEKDDWAKGYDVIIHDECSADVKELPYVNRVLQPHRDGTPGVNLHCAMHCYRTAPNVGKPVTTGTDDSLWFDYIGIQSSGHGAQKPIALTNLAPEFPITKGMADWITINEELYNNIQILPTAKPLLKGKQDAGDKEGQNNTVVAWTNEYGAKKTRVFSTTVGHNNATVSDDRYLNLVTRGILWATDKINADGTAKTGYGPAAAPKTAAAAPAAAPAPATTSDADVTKVMIGVIPAVMKYDKTEFEVKAGAKVMVLFTNKACPLQHNFLVCKPGTKDKVGALADKMLADPNALKNQYIPVSDDILFKCSKLVGIGQSDLIEFTAPTEPGDYPYICTFPGHWRLMNGTMKVK